MNGQKVAGRFVTILALTAVATGCAQKHQQRISMLEDANRNLTQRLNAAQAEFENTGQVRDDLDRRLIAAHDEISALQAQLAEQPIPMEAAPGWTAVPGGAMIAIDDSILFVSGRVTLRNGARRTLDAIVSTIRGEYADRDILVLGHTDNQPIKKSGWADNYQLSTERALAVVRYLRDHAISPNRLVACGCGEHRPRTSNATEVERTANRRVEIFALASGLLGSRP